mgnify:CR=1 FL=1
MPYLPPRSDLTTHEVTNQPAPRGDIDREVPELIRYDAGGRRVDEVRVHPSYNMFLQTGLVSGYAALPWEGKPGGHATHAAMVYLAALVEPGHCCPMTMTFAAVPAL